MTLRQLMDGGIKLDNFVVLDEENYLDSYVHMDKPEELILYYDYDIIEISAVVSGEDDYGIANSDLCISFKGLKSKEESK